MASLKAIQRYLIIIRKIRASNGITLQELKEKVTDELTAHGEIRIATSEKTLKRDIGDIRRNLGISIDYSRTRGYYFPEDETCAPENIEVALESFDLLNALNADTGMNNFVFPERRPYRGTEHLYLLLKAIQSKRQVCFRYQKFGEQHCTERKVYPYAVKEVRNRWYLLCMEEGQDLLKPFGLDRMSELQTLPHTFTPRKIDIEKRYRDCFGIFDNDTLQAEEIILSFDEKDGKYAESQPIHHSQEHIPDPTNRGRYAIRLRVKTTEDFVLELLARGTSLEVHKPEKLRQIIHDIHRQGFEINSI